MDDVRRANPSSWFEKGLAVVVLGSTREELDGSAWARAVHDHLGGLPPAVDLEAEMALGRVFLFSTLNIASVLCWGKTDIITLSFPKSKIAANVEKTCGCYSCRNKD